MTTLALRRFFSRPLALAGLHAVVLVVAGVIGAVVQAPAWFFWGLGGVALAVLVWWAAVRKGGIFGPHFFYDLIRLARRSRTRDVRILYGLALLFGLALVYWMQFPHQPLNDLLFDTSQSMSINDGARFASIFVFTVIVVQNLAVLLLAPVYVGSALTEEKERKTLDLLFTTQMRDHEIVLGKLFSRMVHLGAILLGGLPVLSLAQLWGGIDFTVLLANFVNTGMNLLTVGSVSILVSALCRRVVTAVMIIYGFVLPVTFCLGIFSLGGRTSVLGLAQSDLGSAPGMLGVILGGLGAFHGLITVACLTVALVVMRGQHGAEELFVPPPVERPRPMKRKPDYVEEREQSLLVQRVYDLPPIHNDPLFWKETSLGMNWYVYAPLFWTGLGLSLAMLAMSFLVILLGGTPSERWEARSHQLGMMARVLCCFWGLLCCVGVAYMASSAVVRERQQSTLDGLLTLPLSRTEIVRAKWLGSFFRGWIWWVCFTATSLLGTVLSGLHVSAGLFVLGAVPIHAAFFASLGLFLSVVSKRALSAHGKMAVVLMFLLFGTWLFGEISGMRLEDRLGPFVLIGLNPVRTWWSLGFSWQDARLETSMVDRELAGALQGLACYAALAVIFWLLARWRFGREKNWRME